MVVYDRLDVNGSTILEYDNLVVERSIGDFNSTSYFNAAVDNHYGRHANSFDINDRVEIWVADNAYTYPKVEPVFLLNYNTSGETIVDEINDKIGSAVNSGSFNWTRGLIKSGIQFLSGITNGFNFYNNSDNLKFNEGSPFTLATWINFGDGNFSGASASLNGCIMVKGTTSTSNYGIDVLSGTNPRFRFGVRSGTNTMAVTGSQLTRNEWHHIAGTYNGSNLLQFYNDGAFAGSFNTNGSPFNGGLGSLFIGVSTGMLGGNGTNNYSFTIDDSRIYNVQLTGSEIYGIYNNSYGAEESLPEHREIIIPNTLPGLVGYWRLDEGSGNIIYDEISTNDGTFIGSPSWTIGKNGSALEFNGSNTTVSISNPSEVMLSSGLSICLWMNLNSTTQTNSFPRLVEKEGGSPRNGWNLLWASGTNPYVASEFWSGGTSAGVTGSPSTGWETGTWYHIAITQQSDTSPYKKLYINGSLIKTSTSTLTPGSNSLDMFIAASDSTPTAVFDGKLDDIRVYNRALSADEVSSLATNKINEYKLFDGVVEDIDYVSQPNKENLNIMGRDYGVILLDKIAQPRVFKNKEISEIVTALVQQNIGFDTLSINNVQVTPVTVERITFINVSMFDALKRLARLAGYFFYVDINRDLHFEPKNAISSGYTLDKNNALRARVRKADSEMANIITVYGDTVRTHEEEYFITGTDNVGSVYNLNFQPHNTAVYHSGTARTLISPGGVLNFDDPETKDVKYLVDYQSSRVVLTSGAVAGNNTVPNGSVILIGYDKDTQIVRRRADATSSDAYGPKDKVIVDKNIKSPEEATSVAINELAEFKDPRLQGNVEIYGLIDARPGNTINVDLPFQGIDNQTYNILNANYTFNKINNFSNRVLDINVNKKISDISDIIAEQIKRLRNIEASDIGGKVIHLEVGLGSIGVRSTYSVTSNGIGSSFRFHIANHNEFDSTTSLLGPWNGTAVTKTTAKNLVAADTGTDHVYIFSGLSSTVTGSFATGSNLPRGMAFDDRGNLLIADATADRIYKHSGLSSTLLGSFTTPASNPAALAYDPITGNLISSDLDTEHIYIHSGLSNTLLGSFATPAGDIQGMFVDRAGNLISASTGTDHIYLHNSIAPTLAGSFATPSTSVGGISLDENNNLVSLDFLTDHIYTHSGLSSVLLGSFATFTANQYGLATYIA